MTSSQQKAITRQRVQETNASRLYQPTPQVDPDKAARARRTRERAEELKEKRHAQCL